MNEQNPNLVLVDGEIMPIEEAFVDVNDRGHNFGDGVFELLLQGGHGRCFSVRGGLMFGRGGGMVNRRPCAAVHEAYVWDVS